MFNESALIAKLDAADVDQFATMLSKPTREEEMCLRGYLGDVRFQKLHGLVLKAESASRAKVDKGNVVVIPDLMGSQLSATGGPDGPEVVWLDVPAIQAGKFDALRLSEDGQQGARPGTSVEATGLLKRYYGGLLLGLSRTWNVRAYAYDWRKDIRLAAAELLGRIDRWFGNDSHVHIVAHGMGGLVALAFMRYYPQRWESLQDPAETAAGSGGGRLVLLGCPTLGTYLAPQMLTGVAELARRLEELDRLHRMRALMRVFGSFPSLYQLLPLTTVGRPGDPADLSAEPFFKFETYGRSEISNRHLTSARKFREQLTELSEADASRTVCVLGVGRPTPSGVAEFAGLRAPAFDRKAVEAAMANYRWTADGDGVVAASLGWLSGARTYAANASHAGLAESPVVIAALDRLLGRGDCDLARLIPETVFGDPPQADPSRPPAGTPPVLSPVPPPRWPSARGEDLWDGVIEGRVRSPGRASRGLAPADDAEDADGDDAKPPAVPAVAKVTVEVALVSGRIQDLDLWGTGGLDATALARATDPVDAIAVGHYLGVRPRKSVAAIDEAISAALGPNPGGSTGEAGGGRRVLREFSDRGILRGDLGQPFFLPDPRGPAEADAEPGLTDGQRKAVRGRLIAVAGMGVPGRFGVPELTVLVRELLWSVARLGKRHLATVLIGQGKGTPSSEDILGAWVAGLTQAVSSTASGPAQSVNRVTIVEDDPATLLFLHREIPKVAKRANPRLDLKFVGPYPALMNPAYEKQLRDKAKRRHAEEWERTHGEKPVGDSSSTPTRITFSVDRGVYRLGAITDAASIPEREIPIDPKLVARANDELAAQASVPEQYERGRFLEGLLIPSDLRSELYTGNPLVLMLDATTARVHWEMVAQTTPSSSGPPAEGDKGTTWEVYKDRFLGTSRSLTRQLRTTFAPPPEPPPQLQKTLRVLIVADPAEDAHLPGAELEGIEVADLFEAFNTEARLAGVADRVEVVRLLGPFEATRTNVLRHLMIHTYDVLHYAGHCVFDEADPASSGWIFGAGERISVNELRRIDRIPKFIFSNACQSGITPDRSQLRDDRLAPSFAEAFFERGVSNFVCTAWPVDDAAATRFALTLYCGLLGLKPDPEWRSYTRDDERLPLHRAMQRARLSIASTIGGKTWGAYQHYGNPFFCLFAENNWEGTSSRDDEDPGEDATTPQERPSAGPVRTEPTPPEPQAAEPVTAPTAEASQPPPAEPEAVPPANDGISVHFDPGGAWTPYEAPAPAAAADSGPEPEDEPDPPATPPAAEADAGPQPGDEPDPPATPRKPRRPKRPPAGTP